MSNREFVNLVRSCKLHAVLHAQMLNAADRLQEKAFLDGLRFAQTQQPIALRILSEKSETGRLNEVRKHFRPENS